MAVPKLRFKEFNEDWKENSLKNCVASIDSGWSPLCESNPSEIDEWGVLKTTAVDWDGFKSDFNKKLPLQLSPRLEIEVKPLDILVTRAGPTERVGVVSVVPMTVRPKLMISDKLIRLKVNEQTDASFLGITLSSAKCQSQLQSKTSGLAKSQTNISQKILSDVLLMLPPKTEQTKIASFLSAVDEKISQLNQKHGLLCQYKQGMMQKLFSQQFRFKADDGREFGEWEEKKLGEITKTISAGATPSTLKEEYWGGVIKWMSSGELNFRHVYDVEKTISELGFKSSSTKMLPVNCVLIGLAGQGKTRGTVAVNYIELCTNQSIAAIHPNPKEFDHRFLFFNLDMRYQELRGLSTGDGGRGGLNLQIIKSVELKLPCVEEQTKIANFLSAIDQKIEVIAQQIEQSKTWKKGLLQQMFV